MGEGNRMNLHIGLNTGHLPCEVFQITWGRTSPWEVTGVIPWEVTGVIPWGPENF